MGRDQQARWQIRCGSVLVMAVRREPTVQYRRLIKRTLVAALKTVFTEEYPEQQLRGINVSTAFPLKRENFPAIIVNYSESVVQNAGVGHIEYLEDEDFLTIPAKHFRFEGTIEFVTTALTPLDLDTISDSVVELLAFGRLDALLNRFFDRIYAEVPDSAQISFHSDYLSPLGETQMATLWGSEDGIVYQGGYSIAVSGGFYSTIREQDVAGFIDNIIVYGSDAFTKQEELLLELIGNNSEDPSNVTNGEENSPEEENSFEETTN